MSEFVRSQACLSLSCPLYQSLRKLSRREGVEINGRPTSVTATIEKGSLFFCIAFIYNFQETHDLLSCFLELSGQRYSNMHVLVHV